MKLLRTVLPIVIIIQLSMAASIRRVKREENVVNGLIEIIKLYKRAEPAIDTVMKESLIKMPNTAAYLKYRKEVEEYLEAMVEHKTKPGPCVDKTFAIVTKYDELMEQYDNDNAPMEAQHVADLIAGDERIKTLEDELENLVEKYSIDDINQAVEDLSYNDALILVPYVIEVC